MWGAQGLELIVGSAQASAEFDCASGVVPGPLVLDGSGRFETLGVITLGQGGPVRDDQQPDVHPARYRGVYSDGILTLDIRITDLDRDVGTFQLRRGASGTLVKCL